MTSSPTPQPNAGATNPPNPGDTATPSGNDGSGELRASLARLLAEAEGWSQPTHMHLVQADALLAAGYRRVVVDDATVDRVVDAFNAEFAAAPEGPITWRDYHRMAARAAVRALREDT